MPRPPACDIRAVKIGAGADGTEKKPSPGGEGGPAQAGPDEVEGYVFVPTYVDNFSFDLISRN